MEDFKTANRTTVVENVSDMTRVKKLNDKIHEATYFKHSSEAAKLVSLFLTSEITLYALYYEQTSLLLDLLT